VRISTQRSFQNEAVPFVPRALIKKMVDGFKAGVSALQAIWGIATSEAVKVLMRDGSPSQY